MSVIEVKLDDPVITTSITCEDKNQLIELNIDGDSPRCFVRHRFQEELRKL